MKVLTTLAICFIAINSIGQEKTIDRNAMQNQLTTVNVEIQSLSEKITMVENRMETVGINEEIPANVLEGYRLLVAKKEQLERVAFSINHALNTYPNKTETDEK